jgi:hypothetical protein
MGYGVRIKQKKTVWFPSPGSDANRFIGYENAPPATRERVVVVVVIAVESEKQDGGMLIPRVGAVLFHG